MNRFAFAAVSFSILAISTMAFAAEPQEARQAAMKKVGASIGLLSGMAKGEAPFDAAAAQAAFATMNGVAKEYVSFFPAGSESGFETEASRRFGPIWMISRPKLPNLRLTLPQRQP